MTEIHYWLPDWWDCPVPGYKWNRLAMGHDQSHRFTGGINIEASTPPPAGLGGRGGGGGPPPAAAAAVQVTDAELAAIKRQRRQSREKRLRR
jgi:hypothetical protein